MKTKAFGDLGSKSPLRPSFFSGDLSDLADDHGFDIRVTVAWARLADVHDRCLLYCGRKSSWSESDAKKGGVGRQS